MITHIRMKNFKSWQDSGEVKLAPLTGFFGTNSSGKSSLLQMLLLLKQTVGREEVIFFGDKNSLVNLGNFHEVIHRHDSDATLGLEFGCKLKEAVEIEILGRHTEGGLDDFPVPIDNFSFNTDIRSYGEGLRVERFRYGFEPCDISEIEWEPYHLSYKNLIGKQEKTGTSKNNCYGGPTSKTENVLRPVSSAFEELFSHIYYLGPTRVQPKRLYHWEGTHPKEINLWGDKAIDALLSAGVRKLKSSTKEDGVLIEDRISEWLQKMDLAHSFQLIPTGSLDDKNYEVRIQKSPNSAEVTLADLGHGVADLFPLLVHCYYVPEGSTFILEQPGIHLHPKAQADLADLLIEVITERNLQILIESHSEHLLTRLQLRIAEGKIPASDTALYFCENENGVSNIKPLDVDELGNIKNWPKNFFGNVRGDLVKMTREQMKHQKKAEG